MKVITEKIQTFIVTYKDGRVFKVRALFYVKNYESQVDFFESLHSKAFPTVSIKSSLIESISLEGSMNEVKHGKR